MLQVKNLSTSIDGKVILKDVNITLKDFQAIGIVGKNGAGKTTLFNIICGLSDYTEGQVQFNGKNTTDPNYFQDIYFVPDTLLVHEYLKGIEYIEFVAALYAKSLDKQRVQELLHFFELEHKQHDLIRDYSKGMKMKISILVALLLEPKLIVLDEPFNGLDPNSCIKLVNTLKKFVSECGSVLFSSHTLEFVEQVSDEIYHLNEHTLVDVTSNNLLELFTNV